MHIFSFFSTPNIQFSPAYIRTQWQIFEQTIANASAAKKEEQDIVSSSLQSKKIRTHTGLGKRVHYPTKKSVRTSPTPSSLPCFLIREITKANMCRRRWAKGGKGRDSSGKKRSLGGFRVRGKRREGN